MNNRRLFSVFSKANDKKIYAYCDDQPNVIVNLLSKTKTSFSKQKSGNIIRLESRSMNKSCRFWTFPWKSAISMPSHGFLRFSGVLFWIALLPWLLQTDAIYAPVKAYAKHAYATMLYMGTPHDHAFFVAARVMMQTLARLKVDADLVVIISDDFPKRWIHTFNKEGVRVVSVSNIENPYRNQANFDLRFMFTLNKIYAWSLLDYERVIMLDTDNLFLRKTDELFQCGKFCAVFINPCIFHTGLFVLEPSNETFHDLLQEIKIGRTNKHGADQGFLMSYFENLLEKPLFWPPSDGSKLTGFYRLPLGYQMDASYFCKLFLIFFILLATTLLRSDQCLKITSHGLELRSYQHLPLSVQLQLYEVTAVESLRGLTFCE